MTDLPSGTVTFLFTDIEGSTRLWEQHPDAMRPALTRHDVTLGTAIEAHGGCVFKTWGDQFCAAFITASDALPAALAAQLALLAEEWDNVGSLRVRMALHSGAVEQRAGEEDLWRQRHRDWYLALAERAGAELRGPDQGTWHARLEQEHDNLRAALAWTLAREEADAALRLVGALWRFWDVRGYWTEGRERLAKVLALSAAERTGARAWALIAAAWLAEQQGDCEAAWGLLEECLALSHELQAPREIATALHGLGSVAGDVAGTCPGHVRSSRKRWRSTEARETPRGSPSA